MTFAKSMMLSALACFGLAACHNNPAPALNTQSVEPPETAVSQVSVMTFNLRYATESDGENAWSKRKEDVAALIRDSQVDLLGVQEALVEQMEDLQQALPSDAYHWLGIGRDGERTGEFSAIFYAQDKFELHQTDTFWLSPTPQVPSKGWDAALNRICTWAKFRVRGTQQEFFFFNTHFDHIGEVARQQSAQLILQKITDINPDHLPVILSGDFNLIDSEAPIHLLSTAMQDSFYHAQNEHQGPAGTFQDFKTEAQELERLDYVFTSGFDVLAHAHLDDRRKSDPSRYPSDHFPVLVHLKFQ